MEVILSAKAREDIREACDWYESRSVGLGIKFTTDLINSLKKLKRKNIEYRKYFSTIQYLRLRIFPFSIFFFKEPDSAFFIAVLHNRQDIVRALRGRT